MGPYGYSWQAPRTTDDNPIVPPLNVYVEHYEDGEFVPEFKNYKYIGNKMTSKFICTCISWCILCSDKCVCVYVQNNIYNMWSKTIIELPSTLHMIGSKLQHSFHFILYLKAYLTAYIYYIYLYTL